MKKQEHAGAKIGYVDNARYEINNDKQNVVTTSTTGASISVVSCGAATVSKNLDAGKTYTVTVKTATKTFTTTFSVVDTQASASVKVTKKATTKTNAADILAETCEVTYDVSRSTYCLGIIVIDYECRII